MPPDDSKLHTFILKQTCFNTRNSQFARQLYIQMYIIKLCVYRGARFSRTDSQYIVNIVFTIAIFFYYIYKIQALNTILIFANIHFSLKKKIVNIKFQLDTLTQLNSDFNRLLSTQKIFHTVFI